MSPVRRSVLLFIIALAPFLPAHGQEPGVTGAWVIDEGTTPFRAGSLSVTEVAEGLRFDAKIGDTALAGTVAKSAGPWEVHLARTAGIGGVLAGAETPL